MRLENIESERHSFATSLCYPYNADHCALTVTRHGRYPQHHLSVYTGDTVPDSVIVSRVQDRFGLKLPERVRLVRLRSRFLLDPSCYPVLTLLGQALGSVLVALEAMFRLLPGESAWGGGGSEVGQF